MANQPAPSPARERAYREASEAVHGRLALSSCALWTLGVLAVYLLSAEGIRDMRSTIAAIVLLAPASLLWLARPRLIAIEERRRVAARDAQPDATTGDDGGA